MVVTALVDRVPEGWTRVEYDGRAYGLSRTTRAGGRGVAVLAEELGGGDLVSANVYRTSTGDLLKLAIRADSITQFDSQVRRPSNEKNCSHLSVFSSITVHS